MSRRREANRAEAIVRTVGAIFMVLLLAIVVRRVMPGILMGKSTSEMMDIMMHTFTGFVFLGGLIAVIGLLMWLMVMRSGRKRRRW